MADEVKTEEVKFGTRQAITKVRIIKDILGKDRDGVESLRVTRRRNKKWHHPRKEGDKYVESS